MESQSALNGPSVMPALTRPRIVARVCSRAEGSVAMVVLPRCPRRRLDDRPTPVVLNHPTFEPIVFPLPTPRFFIPAVTPVVANAAIFSLILSPNGLIDSLMQTWFGVQAPNFLGSKTWAMPAVVMLSIWQGFGYNMLVFSAALDAVPTSLTEAAAIDGAGTVARFFRIVLPMITPSIFFAVVLTLDLVLPGLHPGVCPHRRRPGERHYHHGGLPVRAGFPVLQNGPRLGRRLGAVHHHPGDHGLPVHRTEEVGAL